MAGSVNRAIILGHLGKDPVVKYTQGGQAVCEMSIATSERWKDKGGEAHEKTEWHRVVAWGPLAENCGKYLTKGRAAYVEGKIQTRKWTDKETGQDRYTTEIVAQSVVFLGGGERSEGAGDRGGRDDDGARGYLDRQRTGRNAAPQGHGDAPPEDFGPGDDGDDRIPF